MGLLELFSGARISLGPPGRFPAGLFLVLFQNCPREKPFKFRKRLDATIMFGGESATIIEAWTASIK